MIIRKTIIIIILSTAVPFFLHAEQKKTAQKNIVSQKKAVQPAPKPAESGVTEEEADPDDVDAAIVGIVDILRKEKEKEKEKESDPVQCTLLMSYANIFARFSKCARIETDTRFTAVWY